MKAAEKEKVYNLLNTVEFWASGYKPQNFNDTKPLFEDDKETISIQKNITEQNNSSGSISLETIASKISNCKNCILSKTRKNSVPGEGVINPIVMVIGEGPGEEEDNTGRPFVGKSGQLLDKMLGAINLNRNKNCYIANIVKCRPPQNRTPMVDEAEACKGFLETQIHILKPVAILAMGRTAAQNLLHTSEGINTLRGKIFEYHIGNNPNTKGIPLMATFHPSALLHDENLKRPAWNDLKLFKTKLLELIPNYDSTTQDNKAN